jgi:hypothetical protein
MLQLRHKTLPIPIHVKLYEGEERKVEVNSGFPLMDIIPVICKELGRCVWGCGQVEMVDVHPGRGLGGSGGIERREGEREEREGKEGRGREGGEREEGKEGRGRRGEGEGGEEEVRVLEEGRSNAA